MSTRLKRPAFWRHVLVTLILIGALAYLGYSVLTGQFGVESREGLEADIAELTGQASALEAEIESYRHRIDLFRAAQLDPDIVSERARALLAMSEPDDVVVMVDAQGEPVSGSPASSTEDQLTANSAANPAD